MLQLRFTTSNPRAFGFAGQPLVTPTLVGELEQSELIGNRAYIHGDAETLARYDIPIFIDGYMGQLDLPVDEQDILMLLPSGEYKCKAELQKENDKGSYYITLKQ